MALSNVQWFVLKLALSLAIALFVVLSGDVTAQNTPKVVRTNVCRLLANPAAFNGKIVSFKARFAGTWEGAYLSANCSRNYKEGSNSLYVGGCSEETIGSNCQQKVIFTPSEDSKLFSKYAEQLCDAMHYCKYDYITAVFTGEIVTKKGYWYQPRSGWGNGYGHMRATRTAVILSRIDRRVAHKCSLQEHILCRPQE